MPDESKRLIEILRDMGLISPRQLERALEEQQKTGDSVWHVLRRDASFKSLWDFLNYPMFPSGKSEKDQLKNLVIDTGVITDTQFKQALTGTTTGEADLGAMLVEKGIISENQLERAYKEMDRVGHPLWRVLINLNFIDPVTMTQILQNQITRPQDISNDEVLIDILTNTKMITEEDRLAAEQHKAESGQLMTTYLMEKGILTHAKIEQTLEKHLDIPITELNPDTIDSNVVYSLPEDYQRTNGVMPVRRDDKILFLAMINPLDSAVIGRVQFMTGLTVKPMVCTLKEHQKAMNLYFGKPSEGVAISGSAKINEKRIDDMKDLPAVQLATTIIEGAINARATDIHLEPQLPTMRVRYRIDGRLHDVMSIPEAIKQSVFSRIKIMANMDITEKRRPQDGHISMRLFGRELNMRIATVPTYLGEKMVVRLFDEANVLKGLSQLGLLESDEAKLNHLITRHNGMVLVTGPIGSGKTTTLYACLNEINILQNNIVTIEDPVEYRLPGITQIQVNPTVDLHFSEALRAVLRQDADILMVGEIRDAETAKVATWAALTGQLVLCTLHTKDSTSAITMLMNLDVQRFLVSNSLLGVVAQRLVRRICEHCKTEYRPDIEVLESLNMDPAEEVTFARGVGCEHCQQSGYSGRVGVFEILEINDEIRKMIMRGDSQEQIKAKTIEQGMTTMWQDGVAKIKQKLTTPEEVLREVTLE